MKFTISSGHGLHVPGARAIIDEVTEARKVTDRLATILRSLGATVSVFHDNVSINTPANLNAIIGHHRASSRDIDISIHFNASGNNTDAGIGTETLYRTGNTKMHGIASQVSKAIANSSGLILRRGDGTWARDDLAFLNGTNGAILIEICFVNSQTDVRLYKQHFEDICQAIAKTLTGMADGTTSASTGRTAITGKAIATAGQMRAYINRINPKAPDLADIYISEGAVENIRGDIAFAQACLETGNFTFEGSAVTLDQNNFCGMGVIERGMKGASFPTPQIGVRAQIHHLKAYANTEPLVKTNESPRFHLVQRGSAPYVEWLGIQENPHGKGWAAGAGYGEKILRILNAIIATKSDIQVSPNVTKPEPAPATRICPTCGMSSLSAWADEARNTVDRAISDGIVSDRAHWLGVLLGDIPPVPRHIKKAFDNAHVRIAGASGATKINR